MLFRSLGSVRGNFVKTTSVVPAEFDMIGSVQINFRVGVVALSFSCSSFLVERSVTPSRLT